MPAKKNKPVAKKTAAVKTKDYTEILKRFIRAKGAELLTDDNVTSVGIGYKIKDGKPTKQISIQFTVDSKVEPEMLNSVNTTAIPETITVDGVTFPTDVIQRSFSKSFKIVPEEVAGPRKKRIDPIVPGISVANEKVSAGTIACLVFDKQTGAPYVLSNWHVLNGPGGNIGDRVVQPGPFDDNRIQQNQLGKLVRSHLGAAGDCAVASIESRTFKLEILDLNVKPEQIGEPELGDKVIKSGRTTDVTHGVITRIHTMVKINYGLPDGPRAIGGFEIGPDSNNLSPDGEVSKPGDSGSAWLFKLPGGKASKVMAGLHFAGEGAGDPNEHAIACYASSVFEKLEITLTPPQSLSAEAASGGPGYSPAFLGPVVKTPKLSARKLTDAVKLDNSEVIKYTHFSLAQCKSRKFAFWVAWNIDGGNIKKVSRNGIKFVPDPRFQEFQVGDELYAGNRLDRGHIARRADVVWGSVDEAKKANKDSFFFSNITPQMDNFNQGKLGGIWGKLEDAIFEDVDVDNLKVSVFGGPVFKSDDRVFKTVKIPREFYKVIVFVESGVLKAKSFLLTQNLDQLEVLDLNEFSVFQVTLAEIENRCGFTFPVNLKTADSFAEQLNNAPEALSVRKAIENLEDIKW
ncbi:MAG: DNA/RNA non-specific endonuclease [Ferruginibacter sp.]